MSMYIMWVIDKTKTKDMCFNQNRHSMKTDNAMNYINIICFMKKELEHVIRIDTNS